MSKRKRKHRRRHAPVLGLQNCKHGVISRTCTRCRLKNPFSSKTKRRAARVAGKLAYRIWQHIKSKGYALPVPKRTPKLVKKYTQKILAANGIKWTLK
jgi:hypothetical protein